LEVVKAKAIAWNEVTVAAMKKLDGTSELKGITDAISFFAPVTGAIVALNQTYEDLMAKRQIILDAKLEGKIREMLVLNKPGVAAMMQVFPGQTPLYFLPDGHTKKAKPNAWTVNITLDLGIQYFMAIFRGQIKPPPAGAPPKGFGAGLPKGFGAGLPAVIPAGLPAGAPLSGLGGKSAALDVEPLVKRAFLA
jgi:hypothetical protein